MRVLREAQYSRSVWGGQGRRQASTHGYRREHRAREEARQGSAVGDGAQQRATEPLGMLLAAYARATRCPVPTQRMAVPGTAQGRLGGGLEKRGGGAENSPWSTPLSAYARAMRCPGLRFRMRYQGRLRGSRCK
eukprot:44158-Rhodomonas_salina.1